MNFYSKIKYLLNFAFLAAICCVHLACNRRLNMDDLPLPEDLLGQASTSVMKADSIELINDYAQIDTGAKVADGFSLTEATDAERIQTAASSDKSRIFIRLPASPTKRDHVLRSLSAAGMRFQSRPREKWSIKVLNSSSINKYIAIYNFDPIAAKEYYLSLSKRINTILLATDILVVFIDDIKEKISPKDFIEPLAAHHIIALSAEPLDSFEAFSTPKERQEVVTKGLDPGHVFLLAKAHLMRAQGVNDKSVVDPLSLKVAKAITALEPQSDLGSLADLFSHLSPMLDSKVTSPNLEEEIIRSLASFFHAGYQFLTELNLETQTLTEIHQRVMENQDAFKEQARRTEEIHRLVQSFVADRQPVWEQIRKSLTATNELVEGIRNVDLPELKREILDNGDDNATRSTKQVTKALQGILAETNEILRKGLAKNNQAAQSRLMAAIADAHNVLDEKAERRSEELSSSIDDGLKKTMRRIIDSTREDLRTLARDINANANTDDRERKVERIISDALAQMEEGIKEQLKAEQDLTRDEVKRLSKDISRAASSLNSQAKALHDDTKTAIARSRTVLSDAVSDLETRLEEQIKESQSTSQDAMKTDLKRELLKSVRELKSSEADLHAETRRQLMKNASTVADAFADDIKGENAQIFERLIMRMEDRIKTAVTRIIASGLAQSKDVKEALAALLKKNYALSREQIADAQEEIKKIVMDEAELVLDEIQRLPKLNRKESADLTRQLAKVILSYAAIPRSTMNGGGLNNPRQGEPQYHDIDTADVPGQPTRWTELRTKVKSIEMAPRPLENDASPEAGSLQEQQNAFLSRLETIKMNVSDEAYAPFISTLAADIESLSSTDEQDRIDKILLHLEDVYRVKDMENDQ